MSTKQNKRNQSQTLTITSSYLNAHGIKQGDRVQITNTDWKDGDLVAFEYGTGDICAGYLHRSKSKNFAYFFKYATEGADHKMLRAYEVKQVFGTIKHKPAASLSVTEKVERYFTSHFNPDDEIHCSLTAMAAHLLTDSPARTELALAIYKASTRAWDASRREEGKGYGKRDNRTVGYHVQLCEQLERVLDPQEGKAKQDFRHGVQKWTSFLDNFGGNSGNEPTDADIDRATMRYDGETCKMTDILGREGTREYLTLEKQGLSHAEIAERVSRYAEEGLMIEDEPEEMPKVKAPTIAPVTDLLCWKQSRPRPIKHCIVEVK